MADFSDQELQQAASQLRQQQGLPSLAPGTEGPAEFRSTQSAFTPAELATAVQQLNQKSAELSGETPKTVNGRQEDFLDRWIQSERESGRKAPKYPLLSSGQTSEIQNIQDDPNYEWRRRAGLGVLGAGTAAATGAGPIWSAITGLSTSTPADLGTSSIMNAVIPFANKIQMANRGMNAFLGTTKGLSLYEGGDRLHAFLADQQQPSFNLIKRIADNPMELTGILGSALAGGATGKNQIAPGQSKQELAQEAFSTWKQNIAKVTQDITNKQSETEGAKNALQDAKTQLTEHNQTMAEKAKSTRDAATQEFQRQKSVIDQTADDLQNTLDAAKQKVQDTNDAVQNHQDYINARANTQGKTLADSLTDQILVQRQRLRNLNSQYETAYNYLQAEDLTPGAKIALRAGKGIDSDNLEASVEQAKINAQNKIDQLVAERQRYLKGQFVPTDIDLEDYQHLQALQANHATAQQELQRLQDKYNVVTAAQLAHASGGPEKTQADVADVQKKTDLRDQRSNALAAYRKSRQDLLDLRGQRDDLKANAPTKPDQSTLDLGADMIMKLLGKAGPYGAGMLLGHEFGSPIIGGAAVAGVKGINNLLTKTQTGQKVVNTVNKLAGKDAIRAIPGLANYANQSNQ